MNTPDISVITVHKGDLSELQKTVNSLSFFKTINFEHIIVAKLENCLIPIAKETFSRSKLILNKDKSIYDAMNIGLNNASGKFVMFLNSGDELINSIGEILHDYAPTCIQFQSTLAIDNLSVSAMVLNHQNFIAPNSDLRFEDNRGIFSDALWMEDNIKQFGLHKINTSLAKFNYGGISTRPSMKTAVKNLKFDRFLRARIQFLFKAILVFLGAESLNKIILKGRYKS
jgi:glycosyltransferase involved in cell wall biosynthesis